MGGAQRKDRRQINVGVDRDRRGRGREKRRCPDCSGPLKIQVRELAGGSVSTRLCEKCGWSESSRQTDSAILMAKMTWALPLEKSSGAWSASFPAELAEALRLKAGDELVLSPLTLPVGSLPMRWALTVSRKGAKKR